MRFRCFGRSGHKSRDEFQLHRDSEDILGQVVVNLTRDTITFANYGPKLKRHTFHAQAIQLPGCHCQQQDTSEVKPVSLIKAWLQINIHGSATLIPNAIIICRDHSKLVITRPQVCIRGYPSGAAIDPIVVETIEFVSESHVFRRDKTQCRVIEVQPRQTRRKSQLFRQWDRLIIDEELFDGDGWRRSIERNVLGIDDGQSLDSCEPDASVTRLPSCGMSTPAALSS